MKANKQLLNPRYKGETPIEEEDLLDLLMPLSTLKQVDQAEALNITEAHIWLYERKRKFKAEEILQVTWVKKLHKEMYGNVWSYAGSFRQRDTTPGVPKAQISREISALLDDTHQKIENKTEWNLTNHEIALHLSFKAVWIHPFKNGNGRWSRELANALLFSLKDELFTWGESISIKKRHDVMMKAIYAADEGDLSLLMAFAKM